MCGSCAADALSGCNVCRIIDVTVDSTGQKLFMAFMEPVSLAPRLKIINLVCAVKDSNVFVKFLCQ